MYIWHIFIVQWFGMNWPILAMQITWKLACSLNKCKGKNRQYTKGPTTKSMWRTNVKWLWVSQLWGYVTLFMDHTISRKSGQISGGQANGEMTHIHKHTHWKWTWKAESKSNFTNLGFNFLLHKRLRACRGKTQRRREVFWTLKANSRSYKHPT